MATINVDQLAIEIMRNLEIYRANTVEDVKHAVEVVARESAAELRETSPTMSGDYANSWTYGRDKKPGKNYMSMIVYSKKPHYRKTHLLENGHDAVDGSFVNARSHIKAVEKKAGEWMDIMLTKPIGG